MTDFDYLIVGGSMTADAAARGIRERDDTGTIGVVGDDAEKPYTRPALTKKLWTDPDFTVDDNWLATADATGATVMTSTAVAELDAGAQTVTTTGGKAISYGRLLLATGGRPQTLGARASDRVIYFRTLADYRTLRELSGRGKHVAVIGGSFIGSELAAALVQNDTQTTLIYLEPTLGGAMFPDDLAEHFEHVYAEHGVELRGGTGVDNVEEHGDGVTLHLSTGHELECDGLVAGLGIEPRVELASAAGLQVDDGIVVDSRLHTSAENIYAAGDVANYPDRIMGRRRVEHVDNATSMGRTAGRIMTGSDETYDHTPYFYSNVFGIHYQVVGDVTGAETMEDWTEPLRRGVVYYFDDDHITGVLLYNVEDRLDAAREFLGRGRPADATDLVGAIRP